MVLVVPFEQYGTSYLLSTPREEERDEDTLQQFDNFFNVVARIEDASEVRLNGEALTGVWHPIGDSGWAANQVALSDEDDKLGVDYLIHHVDEGVPIGVTAYGFANDRSGTGARAYDSWAYPGGMQLDGSGCIRTLQLPGDGVDNDCDGRRDEEIANGIDDDGDGDTDEDTQLGGRANG